MRRLMAVVAATGLMAATAAVAEDWQPAAITDDMVVGVEVTGIQGDDRLRATRVIFALGRTSPEGADFVVYGAGFDCVSRTVATISTSIYSADGTLLSTVSEEDFVNSPIQPGALLESAESMVCQGRRDPAGISNEVEFAAAARLLLQQGASRR